MEGEAGVDLPALGETPGSAKRRNVVVQIAGHGVANIEVRVAVFSSLVGRVLRNIGQQTRLVVERVTPGIGELRGQAVIALEAKRRLQRSLSNGFSVSQVFPKRWVVAIRVHAYARDGG